MGIVNDIRELASLEFTLLTVVATLGTMDSRNEFVPDSPLNETNLNFCRVELEDDRVIDSNGTEVHTKGSVISLEDNGLFVGRNSDGKEYRFTIPAPWPEPRVLLRAIKIDRQEDEDGDAYEEIIL